MKAITPYINFEGKAEEIFSFYEKVFHGKITNRMLYSDLPEGEWKSQLSDEQKKEMMHMELSVNGEVILMGSDTNTEMNGPLTLGSQINLTIEADSPEESDRLFAELSDGGTAVMPMEKTFWNAYFGMLKDRYGITWLINYSLS